MRLVYERHDAADLTQECLHGGMGVLLKARD